MIDIPHGDYVIQLREATGADELFEQFVIAYLPLADGYEQGASWDSIPMSRKAAYVRVTPLLLQTVSVVGYEAYPPIVLVTQDSVAAAWRAFLAAPRDLAQAWLAEVDKLNHPQSSSANG